MIPYREAGRAVRQEAERPIRALQNAASIGAGAAGISGASAAGVALMKRALPFLSKYIPQDLAIKGLNKLDPRFGKFIKNAMNDGHEFNEVKDFIEEKGVSELEKIENPKEERNIIQQYSPDLFQAVDQLIKNGMTPEQAGASVEFEGKFTPFIKKMVKDHKTPWSNILKSVFGEGQINPQQQSQPQQPQGQPQQGQGAQSIAQAMQRINSLLGG